MIDRARHVSCDRIHGFVLTGESIGATPIDDMQSMRCDGFEYVIHRHDPVFLWSCDEITGGAWTRFGGQSAGARCPGGEPTAQHGNRFVPQPAKQPPSTCCVDAAPLIVHDDLSGVIDAPPTRERGKGLWGWQWVSP